MPEPARPHFVYVKIPADKDPDLQDLLRDDAIDQALRAGGAGLVLGWGSSLGDVRADGSRPIAFHRIDIQATDLEQARAVLRDTLPPAGAPTGTEIHFTQDEQARQDVYAVSGWQLGQAYALPGAHPARGGGRRG